MSASLRGRLRRFHIRFVLQPGQPAVLGYTVGIWRRDKLGTLRTINCQELKDAILTARSLFQEDRRNRMVSISRLSTIRLKIVPS